MESLRTARRFCVFWGAIALFQFCFAGYLTRMITSVYPKEFNEKSPRQEVGIFTHSPRDESLIAAVDYRHTDGSNQSSVEVWIGGLDFVDSMEVILNHVAGPSACYSEDDVKLPLKLITVDDYSIITWKREHNSSETDVNDAAKSLRSRQRNEFGVTCRLNSVVDHESYAERRIYFEDYPVELFRDSNEPIATGGKRTDWTLSFRDMEDVKDITFLTHSLVSGTKKGMPAQSGINWGATREFAFGDRVEVRWDSLTSEMWRDIIIVIIGALVALGAAMVIEAIRPFVEHIAATHKPSARIRR